MNSYDRRIVHNTLKDDPELMSFSQPTKRGLNASRFNDERLPIIKTSENAGNERETSVIGAQKPFTLVFGVHGVLARLFRDLQSCNGRHHAIASRLGKLNARPYRGLLS